MIKLAERMKEYEAAECSRRLSPMQPVIARIDGRTFSSFTRGAERPFDRRITQAMVETTRHLMVETNACMGYTQSDEITLAWLATDERQQIWFDGRVTKMTSQLAAHATLRFNRVLESLAPEFSHREPTFDARVWSVPDRKEGANVFRWREWDAIKNSISMAARSQFSTAELHGKNSRRKKAMLLEKGIDWDDYPLCFKHGTFFQRRLVTGPFSADELEALPPKHAARSNPGLCVERTVLNVINLPALASIKNLEAVVFDGASPEMKTDVLTK